MGEIIQEKKKRKRKDEGGGKGGARYLCSNVTDPALVDGARKANKIHFGPSLAWETQTPILILQHNHCFPRALRKMPMDREEEVAYWGMLGKLH